MRVKAGIPAFLTMGVVAISGTAFAAEYSVTPFADLRLETYTNKRLAAQDTDVIFGGTLDLGATMNAATDSSSFSLVPRFSLIRLTDDGTGVDQDRENYYINSNASHRFSERLSLGASLNFANTGVIASELDDLGIILDTPTSFSRRSITFSPSMTYVLTERDSLRFGASFTDNTYDDDNNTELSDYNRYSVNASWLRQWSEKGLVTLFVYASKQESDLSPLVLSSVGPAPQSLISENEERGITLGYRHSFSESLIGNISMGVRNTDNDFPLLNDFDFRLSPASAAASGRTEINRNDPVLALLLTLDPNFLQDSIVVNRIYTQGSASNTGLLFDASVEKQYEITRFTGGFSRSSEGTGLGVNQERDEFFVTAERDLSDRMVANGAFRYFTTTLENDRDENTIDQIRLEAGLRYRLSEYWTLGGGYAYRRINSDLSTSRDDHSIFFTVGYNGNKYAISR